MAPRAGGSPGVFRRRYAPRRRFASEAAIWGDRSECQGLAAVTQAWTSNSGVFLKINPRTLVMPVLLVASESGAVEHDGDPCRREPPGQIRARIAHAHQPATGADAQ